VSGLLWANTHDVTRVKCIQAESNIVAQKVSSSATPGKDSVVRVISVFNEWMIPHQDVKDYKAKFYFTGGRLEDAGGWSCGRNVYFFGGFVSDHLLVLDKHLPILIDPSESGKLRNRRIDGKDVIVISGKSRLLTECEVDTFSVATSTRMIHVELWSMHHKDEFGILLPMSLKRKNELNKFQLSADGFMVKEFKKSEIFSPSENPINLLEFPKAENGLSTGFSVDAHQVTPKGCLNVRPNGRIFQSSNGISTSLCGTINRRMSFDAYHSQTHTTMQLRARRVFILPTAVLVPNDNPNVSVTCKTGWTELPYLAIAYDGGLCFLGIPERSGKFFVAAVGTESLRRFKLILDGIPFPINF